MKCNHIFFIMLACMLLSSGFQTNSLAEDVSARSDFSFRLPSDKEEFGIIWNALKMMPFYNKYGYQVELPDQKEFQQLAENPDALNNANRNQLYSIFVNNQYNKSNYKNGLCVLKSKEEAARKALTELCELKRLWGFKIYKHYDVALTLYGPGGTYDPSSGKVFIRATSDGSFVRKEPIHTVVHEMVHLGIDQNIKERYDLDHNETERVVDYICSKYLGHVLTGYREMSLRDEQLDGYLDKNAILNLPQAIENYASSIFKVLVVEKVYGGSQAQRQMLREGDIIYKYSGKRTTKIKEFARMVKEQSDKDRIEMIVFRDGKARTFNLNGGPLGVKITEAKIAKANLLIP